MQEQGPRERLLVWLLRLGGVMTVLAFPTALLPAAWMELIHVEWLGMGDLAYEPITGYMARSLSLLYGFHGVFTLIVSTDVRRYRPLVGFLGWMLLIFGPALLLVDFHSGMPLFWTLAEGPSLMLFGAVILYLRRSVPSS